jgi:hypothetical protein
MAAGTLNISVLTLQLVFGIAVMIEGDSPPCLDVVTDRAVLVDELVEVDILMACYAAPVVKDEQPVSDSIRISLDGVTRDARLSKMSALEREPGVLVTGGGEK